MTERISASVVGRHLACHASANLELAIPNWVAPVQDPTANNAANRGTDMHDELELITKHTAKDMLRMAQALTYVAELRQTRRFNVLTEAEVEAGWLTSKPKTKVDVVLYTQDEIHVIDWKTGKIPVDVYKNPQLMYYALCFAPLAPKAKGVTLHIVQPWAENMESYFATTAELAQFMADVQAAEVAILGNDMTFGPSDDCKFCPANPQSRGLKGTPLCPEMMGMLYPRVVDDAAILDL